MDVGESATNLECHYIYKAVFLLSTHIAGSSCARLIWPGPWWFVPSFTTPHATCGRGLLHHHDLRERVPLVVTQPHAVAVAAARVEMHATAKLRNAQGGWYKRG